VVGDVPKLVQDAKKTNSSYPKLNVVGAVVVVVDVEVVEVVEVVVVEKFPIVNVIEFVQVPVEVIVICVAKSSTPTTYPLNN
jgi:hypothetical protein